MVRDTTLGPWRWMGIVVVAPCFPPVLVESVTVCNDTCNDASPAQRPWSQSLFNHHDTRRVNGWRATDCVVLLARAATNRKASGSRSFTVCDTGQPNRHAWCPHVLRRYRYRLSS